MPTDNFKSGISRKWNLYLVNNMNTIILKPHKEESLLRFHPWVFSGAISRIKGNPNEGDLVTVRDSIGNILGCGHYQIGSIAVRILLFGSESLPPNFWHDRLQQSYTIRRTLNLIRPDNNCYRLIHGEGDFLPGLVVDIYGETAVVQAHSVGMHQVRNEIAKALPNVVEGLKNVYYKSENTLPFKADIPLSEKQDQYLIGSAQQGEAVENGLRFRIDWLNGQKTGFFIDQRYNRSLLEQYAFNRRVLNMFCYTGGFSVYAMRGNALGVDSVDSSSKAVDLVRRNMEINFGADKRHNEYVADAFEFMNNIDGKYNLIVLDPPAFAKHRNSIKHALQGYIRLNAKAFKAIDKDGILFTFSCSQAIDKEMFRQAVFTAAAQSGRRVRILHQLTQPADHPINIYHPEGEYLKGLVLYVE